MGQSVRNVLAIQARRTPLAGPVDIWTNFGDYGLLPPAGLVRADAHNPPFRSSLQVRGCAPLADDQVERL